jgi:ribulose-5-phosphate 4-epimerase/fuculose-1-phosphate aldolase
MEYIENNMEMSRGFDPRIREALRCDIQKAAGLSSSTAGIVGIMDNIAFAGMELGTKGWTDCGSGNISARIDGVYDWETKDPVWRLPEPYANIAGKEFVMTSTGSNLKYLGLSPKKTMCVIGVGENGVDVYRVYGEKPPTLDYFSHLMLYEKTRANAVVHAHAKGLTIMSNMIKFFGRIYGDRKEADTTTAGIYIHDGKSGIDSFLDEPRRPMHMMIATDPENVVKLPRGMAIAPYACPGTTDLASRTVEAMTTGLEPELAIWEGHGAISIGKGSSDADPVEQALMSMFEGNKAAESIIARSHIVPLNDYGMRPSQLKEIAENFHFEQNNGIGIEEWMSFFGMGL